MKAQGGTVEVVCGCSPARKVFTKDFYVVGGLFCKVCQEKLQTVPQHRPDTHKSSRERHGGHSGPSKEEARTKQAKNAAKNKR